ncbi:MAG: hypothetical protein A7315_00225 [Candidatus Altiarchaeales archaeon WOR_SM1_79]|nr:MAG: hypothetical protein A7315_00225 [Candidatus Altiarchaeales archaeon WOR_SM1_79]
MVDTNEVLSALLSKGGSFDIFLSNSFLKRYEFIAPEFMFFEIGNNFGEIVTRSKLSPEVLGETFKFIKDQIDFMPFEEFNECAKEAEKLSPHPKDIQYFALALKFNCPIWSEENSFKKQNKIRVFSTYDLIQEFM